jgi:uncharacterized protein (TIGR00255 family)
MLLSMTGHGAGRLQQSGVTVTVEIRTVNNRYYKMSMRTTEGYAALESRIDDVIRQSIRRGSVQLDLRVDREISLDSCLLNEAALVSYAQQLRAIQKRLGLNTDVRIDQLLELPGVVNESSMDGQVADSDWPVIERAIQDALAGLAVMRQKEGRAMARDLEENCRAIAGQLDSIEQLAPVVVDSYRGRLTDRLNKLLSEHGVTVQTADVVREVGLFAERSDIGEEIVRLRSHLEQFLATMGATESSGRKLDFITQEMFREANTIGSKSNDAGIARHVVEVKAAIERIREMIQNIE